MAMSWTGDEELQSQPQFDPMFYATNPKYGKYTRIRAAMTAHDAGIITFPKFVLVLDEIIKAKVDRRIAERRQRDRRTGDRRNA